MFEVCEVTVNGHIEGSPKPGWVTWAGEQLAVIDHGRRWQTDNGQHILVRLANGSALELWFDGTIWRGRSKPGTPSNFV
ncbi:MAG: hypothetical protein GYB66_06600 [Chloroflexi bacterium]|nr:hypothetical protein [Chloroflexota bacterium]